MPAEELLEVQGLVEAMGPELGTHGFATNIGFVELWAEADPQRRARLQAALGAALAPLLERHFEGYRALLFNVWIKTPRSEGSLIPMHRDFAVIDERGGRAALQIWIPLVDLGPDNGALILLDGSHRDASATRQYRPWRALTPDPLEVIPEGAQRPTLRAGEGVVFSNRTLHGSARNRSAEPRPAVGCVLVPRDAPVVHWVRRPPDREELWELSDDEFHALRPGRLPPGARLVEIVEPGAPPEGLALASGEWIRYRRIPGLSTKVVLTAPDGRFRLLSSSHFSALQAEAMQAEATQAETPTRERLSKMGFLHAPIDASRPPAPRSDRRSLPSSHRIVLHAARGAGAAPESMLEATALGIAARIVEGATGPVHIELGGRDPLRNEPVARALIRALGAGARARGIELSFFLKTDGGGLGPEAAEWLVDARIPVGVYFDGLPELQEAHAEALQAPPFAQVEGAIRELQRAHAARRIPRSAAYLNGILTVSRATIAASPGELVGRMQRAGLTFLDLRALRAQDVPEGARAALVPSATDFLTFYAAFLRKVLEVNVRGELLVDKRLALYFESLRLARGAEVGPPGLVYAPDGRVYASEGAPLDLSLAAPLGDVAEDALPALWERAERASESPAEGCAACAYDPYCGSGLLQSWSSDRPPAQRSWGSDWCLRSMGTFDEILSALGSSDRDTLRRVFARWMAARDAARARLRG